MAKTSGPVLGVNIGSATVKVVELRQSRDGIELMSAPLVFATPPDTVQGGVIVDPATLGSALADELSAANIKTKRSVSSVSGQQSLVVRITEVPKMSEGDLKEAIQWELDRQTPFPVDEIIYDYAPIERPDADAASPNMEVLLAVAQEEMINMHVEALMAAGLQPLHVDIEPLALGRAIVNLMGDQLAGQTVVILNIGSSATEISIMRDGLLSFVRTIPTAGDSLTRAIGQGFIVETEEAERLKRQYADLNVGQAAGAHGPAPPAPPDTGGLDLGGGQTPGAQGPPLAYETPDEQPVFELSSTDDLQPPAQAGAEEEPVFDLTGDRATHLELDAQVPEQAPAQAAPADPDVEYTQRQIYDTIVPVLAELTTELHRSLDFYRRQHRNEQVDFISLAGGSAAIRGLDTFVQNEVGIRTFVAAPFQSVVCDPALVSAEYLRDIGPVAAVAVGLAVRDMIE